jgi:hypothetical protein
MALWHGQVLIRGRVRLMVALFAQPAQSPLCTEREAEL